MVGWLVLNTLLLAVVSDCPSPGHWVACGFWAEAPEYFGIKFGNASLSSACPAGHRGLAARFPEHMWYASLIPRVPPQSACAASEASPTCSCLGVWCVPISFFGSWGQWGWTQRHTHTQARSPHTAAQMGPHSHHKAVQRAHWGLRTFSEHPWCQTCVLASPTLCTPWASGLARGRVRNTRTHPVRLGGGPLGLAVVGPMAGQANCRGRKHRAAQRCEHPTPGPLRPSPGSPLHLPTLTGLGVEVCLLYLESPKYPPPSLTPTSWPRCLQCGGRQRPSPKPRGVVCAALSQCLAATGDGHTAVPGTSPTLDQRQRPWVSAWPRMETARGP